MEKVFIHIFGLSSVHLGFVCVGVFTAFGLSIIVQRLQSDISVALSFCMACKKPNFACCGPWEGSARHGCTAPQDCNLYLMPPP